MKPLGRSILLLVLAIICFAVLVVLIIADSTSTKLEAVLEPLGLAFGFASFLPGG